MLEVSFVVVTAEQTLPLRQQVLWPGFPADFSRVEGGQDARHYGALHGDTLVSVASVFPENETTARLRKFATLPEWQGQGIGSAMLEHIFLLLRADGFTTLWCDGREQARAFYERLGFQASGQRFFKEDIAYFTMTKAF